MCKIYIFQIVAYNLQLHFIVKHTTNKVAREQKWSHLKCVVFSLFCKRFDVLFKLITKYQFITRGLRKTNFYSLQSILGPCWSSWEELLCQLNQYYIFQWRKWMLQCLKVALRAAVFGIFQQSLPRSRTNNFTKLGSLITLEIAFFFVFFFVALHHRHFASHQ